VDPIGAAFGRYSLPTDDLIDALEPTLSSTAEDPAYPLTNWYEVIPSKPAKLTTANGRIIADFGTPVNVAATALLYHNIDANIPVYLEWNSSNSWGSPIGSQLITIPDWTEEDPPWSVSPFIEVTGTPTYRYWSLVIGGSGSPLADNSQAISIGRWAILGALRDLTNDVRWGVEEGEEHNIIEHDTILGVETIYPLGGKRRSFNGEFALRNEAPYQHAQEFIAFCRSAQMRVRPWVLIPDVDVNEAWIVRFEDNRWSRTRETLNQNIFPFRVKELSRGVPWP
jgi:hypothetical protein